jgi:hypothetical protein
MSSERGVDAMHIAHHGSESSTSGAYYNLMKPEVVLISVGLNQGTFLHPREDVVNKVLLTTKRSDCVKAPPLKALFQTEDGIKGCSSTGCTSFPAVLSETSNLTRTGRAAIRSQGLTMTMEKQPTQFHPTTYGFLTWMNILRPVIRGFKASRNHFNSAR